MVVYNAAMKLECQSKLDKASQSLAKNEVSEDVKKDPAVYEKESNPEDKSIGAKSSSSGGNKSIDIYNIKFS